MVFPPKNVIFNDFQLNQWLKPLFSLILFFSNFDSRKSASIAEINADESNIVRINLPFKDQVSANSVRRQMLDLGNKIGLALQPVFVSKKLATFDISIF